VRRKTDEEIEDVMRRLRVRLGIDDQDCPDMLAALVKAKALGIIKDYVQVDALPNNAEAAYDPNEQKIFFTKPTFAALTKNDPRARFTLAHEFGHEEFDHARTRYRSSSSMLAARKSASVAEKREEPEANRAGAAFLCPYHRANYRPGMTAEQVARKFKVSLQVAEIRLQVLERMYRREHGIPRPLPGNVVDLLRTLQGKGSPLKSLEVHERAYGAFREKSYEGHQCPNPSCREFTMVRNGTQLRCDLCGAITGVD
jgi:Zn-dependent peptidase ImmA (M78 family)